MEIERLIDICRMSLQLMTEGRTIRFLCNKGHDPYEVWLACRAATILIIDEANAVLHSEELDTD